jgi:GNAT superfamily N-acetyltransferase
MQNTIVSTDKTKLDVAFIHDYLSNRSYWAKGRTVEEVKTTIKHCVCFGIYLDTKQIGFARVLTDYTVFAYLFDVFIDEQHRGNGYSIILLDYIFNYKPFKNIQGWKLKTTDAGKLYERYGFKIIDDPHKMMEKKKS